MNIASNVHLYAVKRCCVVSKTNNKWDFGKQLKNILKIYDNMDLKSMETIRNEWTKCFAFIIFSHQWTQIQNTHPYTFENI